MSTRLKAICLLTSWLMLCSSGYAQEKLDPVEELVKLRSERLELAIGVSELKHDLALAEADVEYWRERAEAVDPGWFEKLLRSTAMDLVWFVLGTWFGVKMVNAAGG